MRLGINAPRTIQVHRKEVYDAIKRENAAAAEAGIDDLPGIDAQARRDRPRTDG